MDTLVKTSLFSGICSLVTLPYVVAETIGIQELQFCTFFNNRGPKPQPNLRNCTWFGKNSCCMQEEIDAEFSTMKPIPGASLTCQRYTNYFLCYICAPYQNSFYIRERLTVCEEFCDAWYDACRSAILKGSVISSLHKNGRDFCRSRSYEVDTVANQKCYMYDPQMKSMAPREQYFRFYSGLLTFIMLLVYVS
ncbi:hypothetical protein FSP39_010362 [Pinctada imbricata]|uniref:Folate receptor-like domain-containing protein n=1 Tax=Pinctada imbricata TaxID=66713 RepID=A0AA88XRD4_PINIB|nr:hypothetical protein FSP39_010362 [Pinctada imbricata]